MTNVEKLVEKWSKWAGKVNKLAPSYELQAAGWNQCADELEQALAADREGRQEPSHYSEMSEYEKAQRAIDVQTSLLNDLEEMTIDNPGDTKLATRIWGRIDELKKTIALNQKTLAAQPIPERCPKRLKELLDAIENEFCFCGAKTEHRNKHNWEYCHLHRNVDAVWQWAVDNQDNLAASQPIPEPSLGAYEERLVDGNLVEKQAP